MGKELKIHNKIVTKVKRKEAISELCSFETGSTFNRYIETTQLLVRYEPFLEDISELRVKSSKPFLNIKKDWEDKLNSEAQSQWLNSKTDKSVILCELKNISKRYKSQRIYKQILFYFLYNNVFDYGGINYNSYVELPHRSSHHMWGDIYVYGILDKKEVSQMQNTLGAYLEGTFIEPEEKNPKNLKSFASSFDKDESILLINYYLNQRDYNGQKYRDYCENVYDLSKKFFKNYKLSTKLYENLCLLYKYEQEYRKLKSKSGVYNRQDGYKVGPTDIFYELYTDSADDLNDDIVKELRANIRKIMQRVASTQKKRFCDTF